MSEISSVAVGTKRKMRKGTASCVECRRRKIRCTFIRGDSRCSNCLGRGTQCIDQRDVDYAENSPEDSNTSLRERVAGLERQLSDVLQSLKGDIRRRSFPDTAYTPENSDGGPAEVDSEPQRPTVLSTVGGNLDHWRHSVAKYNRYMQISNHDAKAKDTCKALRSTLPPFDELITQVRDVGSWWTAHREKIDGLDKLPVESLAAFASRAYTSDRPGEIGTLVVAHARHTWLGRFHVYPFVESLVTADAVFSSTLEGIECLVLTAQCYLDIGQPRRAWLQYRRGLSLAHILGLDRNPNRHSRESACWWAMYHGDRFSSMLMGLSCGVNDTQYGFDVPRVQQEQGTPEEIFMLRCAVVAGKNMDRCSYNGLPFRVGPSTIEDLEAEMDDVSLSIPRDWWALPSLIPEPGLELDSIRRKLMQQAYYFQVRMYLYLPHLGEVPGGSHWADKHKCIESARQLLSRSVILCSTKQAYRVFQSKTTDFVGFIAAAVLTIGLFSLGDHADPQLAEDDHYLVESIQDILHRDELSHHCPIASQCCRALDILSNKPRDTTDAESEKIVIPYFGTVVRKYNKSSVTQTPESQLGPITPQLQTMSGHVGGAQPHHQFVDGMQGVQAAGMDGQMAAYALPDDLYWELKNSGSYFTEDFNPVLDPHLVDLSQDWSMFATAGFQQL